MFLILFLDGGDNMEPLDFFSGNASAASAVVCGGGKKNKKQNINGWNAGRLKKTSDKECFFFLRRG